jgi:penicillin-binding protein 1A
VLPYAIESISDRQGKPLYIREGGGLGEVIGPDALKDMNQMMTAVISRGTGTAADFGYPAGGKTGTSSDFRDAWFMGYTADYVTGVWVGNDSGAGMKKVTGGGLPAHVWRDVMVAAHAGHEPRALPGQEPAEKPDLIARFLESIIGK